MISNHLFDMVTSALSDACENSKLAKAKIPISHRNLNRLQFIINKPTADFDGNLNFLIDNLKEDNSELYSIFDAIFNKPHQSIDSLKEDLEKLRPEKPALPEEELILPEEDNNPLGKAEKLKKVYAQREKINLYSKQLEMDIFANKFIDSFIKKLMILKMRLVLRFTKRSINCKKCTSGSFYQKTLISMNFTNN